MTDTLYKLTCFTERHAKANVTHVHTNGAWFNNNHLEHLLQEAQIKKKKDLGDVPHIFYLVKNNAAKSD